MSKWQLSFSSEPPRYWHFAPRLNLKIFLFLCFNVIPLPRGELLSCNKGGNVIPPCHATSLFPNCHFLVLLHDISVSRHRPSSQLSIFSIPTRFHCIAVHFLFTNKVATRYHRVAPQAIFPVVKFQWHSTIALRHAKGKNWEFSVNFEF